jgi:thioredoxin
MHQQPRPEKRRRGAMPAPAITSARPGLVRILWVVPYLFLEGVTSARRAPWTTVVLPPYAGLHVRNEVLSLDLNSRIRGGDSSVEISSTGDLGETTDQVDDLDTRVRAAMQRLGLGGPASAADDDEEDEEETEDQQVTAEENCANGVCSVPETRDVYQLAKDLAVELNVDPQVALAALGSTRKDKDEEESSFDVDAARKMIQDELQYINSIPEDDDRVKLLVAEGFDTFLVRRALAFVEGDVNDARAVLEAEREDADMEEMAEEEASVGAAGPTTFKTVAVKTDFDPTQIGASNAAEALSTTAGIASSQRSASKADVVFEATTAQIQELVLESPVPVLLDIYADWCGPCKVLGPALEDMAVKSGGLFRLVKVNTDKERPVSDALEVSALPTVFAIRDGRIVHTFQGMPRSEQAMKSFMLGLLTPQPVGTDPVFDPPVTPHEKDKYAQLTAKLVKMAGVASFSFASRERLQDRITVHLDKLATETTDLVAMEETCNMLRSLLSNVIRDPLARKYRTVKLSNKKIHQAVTQYPAAVSILNSVGFKPQDSESEELLTLGRDKKVVNVAPLSIVQNTIDRWLSNHRSEVSAAERKRRDMEERARLHAEGAFDKTETESDEEEEKNEVDTNVCRLNVRIEGKKKVHQLELHSDDPLEYVLTRLPIKDLRDDTEVKITCAAKRLVLTDRQAIASQSLRQLGLTPSSSIVVSVASKKDDEAEAKSILSTRAAKKTKKKTGSHTMHSIGVYAKDDNAKGELVESGGGAVYEQDVTDDEEEPPPTPLKRKSKRKDAKRDKPRQNLEDEAEQDENDD